MCSYLHDEIKCVHRLITSGPTGRNTDCDEEITIAVPSKALDNGQAAHEIRWVDVDGLRQPKGIADPATRYDPFLSETRSELLR